MSGKTFTYILCIFLFCECRKTKKLSNLNNDQITVLAHRGAGASNAQNPYPDNTIESMAAGIDQLGADGIEMDLQLTKDSFPILYHEVDLSSGTNCAGKVNGFTLEEIRNCSVNASFYNIPPGKYAAPALEDVFERFRNYSSRPVFFLDTKSIYEPENYTNVKEFHSAFANALNRLVEKFNAYDNTLISSSDMEMLKMLQSLNPKLKLILHADDFSHALDRAKSAGIFGITIHHKNISRKEIEDAHANGLRVALWGVGTKKSCKETIRLFPDYVKTDDVSYMMKLAK